MGVTLNPYLSFKDNARQAMVFYKSVFGGELTSSTFADLGGEVEPDEKDLIMHSQLVGDNGIVIMGADTPSHMEFKEGSNGQVSLSGDDDDALRGYWTKLSESGTVSLPLETAPWGDAFGMCVDKFGVPWLVNIAAS